MSEAVPAAPTFLDAGESALVVEFGRSVDPALSDRVLALDAALAVDPPEGLRELVPTYRSLMIHYDPLRLDRARLVARVEAALASPSQVAARSGALWTLPCCYAPPHGEDLAEMAGLLGLTADRAAELHAAGRYRVYMYGFSPGFTYLGGLPEPLAISRRARPRPPHDSQAVLVGGGLCAVAHFAMPTGWYVVGRTPERLYAPERSSAFLFEPGDQLAFEPIDAETFTALEARAQSGEIVARKEPA